MKNLALICLTFICLLNYACKKEVPGCMDSDSLNFNEEATMDDGSCVYLEDLFIGEWEVRQFFLNGVDLIQLNLLRNNIFEFERNRDFEWEGEQDSDNDGVFLLFRVGENWQVNPRELSISGALDGFCEGLDDFEFDFKSANELEIETTCDDGTFIRINLSRL